MVSTVVTAGGNYLFSILLAWVLLSRDYSAFAAGSSLLLLVGTVAAASLPWVLAREVASGDPDRARLAAGAAASAGVVLAAVAALVAVLASAGWADRPTQVVIAVACFAIFLSSNIIGELQGLQQFVKIAVCRIVELVVRVGLGTALVLGGTGSWGALVGFAAGGVAILVVAWPTVRGWGRPRRPTRGQLELLRGGLGQLGVRGAVAALVGLDVIVAAAVWGTDHELAVYQVASVLGRIPMFVGVALSMIYFARLTVARASGAPGAAIATVREAAALYMRSATPLALGIATVPTVLVGLVLPDRYGDLATLLVISAVAGWAIGAVNLVATFLQAAEEFVAAAVPVGVAALVLVPVVVVATTTGSATVLATGVAAVFSLTAIFLWRNASRLLSGPDDVVGHPGRALVRWVPAGVALGFGHAHPVLWFVVVLIVGVSVARGLLKTTGVLTGVEGRLRVLHLAFEDPRAPGAGGGSVRTREIARRLASDFDQTVLVAAYPGCRDYEEEGVRYRHIGVPAGTFGSILAYFAAIPAALARHDSDLVVEDFAAPFSSVSVPRLTRRPVVGVVQWLFAEEKAKQYHLPFTAVQTLGVRSHRRLIAVSDDLSDTLRRWNPFARVDTVHNGLDPAAFTTVSDDAARRDLVYLGRLESAQKGLDLLLEAYALVAHRVSADLVLAGDGPDEGALRRRAAELDIAHRVRFAGRVGPADKFAFLASARLVLMPSRYETFGMVAAEAAAVGTPVLAFDIPCLRALVDGNGVLVEPFDVPAYAVQIARLADDAEACVALGAAGRAAVADLNWDDLARRQADVYRAAVAGTPLASGTPARSDGMIGDLARPHRSRGGRERPRRVLLVGNYGNGNTGDEAICSRLSELLDEAEVTVVSRNPAEVTRLHGVRAVPTLSRSSVLAALRCDLLAIGGGGMFGKGLPPLVRVLPGAALGARALGKHIAFVALGAYASTPRSVQIALRVAGRVAEHVSVRDDESVDTFRQGWFRRDDVVLVDDPAVALAPASRQRVAELLHDHGVDPASGRPLLGVSVKPAPDPLDTELIIEATAAAAQEWIDRRDGDIVCVALSDQGDYGLGPDHADAVLAARVAERLSEPGRLRVVGPGLHPRTAKGVFAACELIVGVRLHAMIFGTSSEVPVIGLSFEPKARAWLRATCSVDVPLSTEAPAVVAQAVREHTSGVAEGRVPTQVVLPLPVSDGDDALVIDLGAPAVVQKGGVR